MKNLKYLTIAIIIVLSAALLASCKGDKDPQPAAKQETTTPVEEQAAKPEKEAAETEQEGAQSEEQAAESEAAPAQTGEQKTETVGKTTSGSFTWDDIPLFPGAEKDDEALAMGGTSSEGIRTEIRHFKTSDSFDKVRSFYQSEMQDNGWELLHWSERETTTEGWIMENGIFEKNKGHDNANVGLLEKDDGIVRISLMRSNDQDNPPSGASSDASSGSGSTFGQSGAAINWDDVPAFPGSSAEEAAWMSSKVGGNAWSETRLYTTDMSIDEVATFYQEQMVAYGWTEILFTTHDELAIGMYEKDDGNDSVQITIGKNDEGGVSIGLTWLQNNE